MYKTQSFKKKMLVTAVASAAMAGFAAPTFAQDEAVEEVVVTGIRASLERAVDVKRESAGVVDAINAEDMGKFPDSNLAESLQRITGVSIDRRNGEGFQVTVRGFGPQYNLITLNGRNMPATQLGPRGGLVANRSFDMSNIASEGISAVEVYKTGKAHVQSGGIGAAINLKTLRPMDNEGIKASFGVKAVADTTVRVGDDITPELSGIFSWSNDMFGASVSMSHQERDSSAAGVFNNNWNERSGPYGDSFFHNNTNPNRLEDGGVTNGQQANYSPGVRYHYGDFERERDNAQVVLQVRPFETLTATLDYTEAKQEEFVNSSEFSYWFGGGAFPVTNVLFDGNENAVATPIYMWTENQGTENIGGTDYANGVASGSVRDIGITQNQGHVQNDMYSKGLNVTWEATDSLSFELDGHKSVSKSLPGDGAVGNYFNIATGAQGNYAQGYINTGDLPLLVAVFNDRYLNDDDGDESRDSDNDGVPDWQDTEAPFTPTPQTYGVRDGGLYQNYLDVADLGSTVRQINYDRAWTDIDEVRLSGKWELDNFKIDFGVSSSEMESTQKSSFDQNVLEGNWGVGTPGDVPADMMREINYANVFKKYRTSMTAEDRAWFNAAGTDDPFHQGTAPTGRYAEVMLRGFLADDVGELGKLLSRNNNMAWAPNADDGTNRTITEEITAFYLQGSTQWEIGSMPLDATLGVRYEKTDVTSESQIGQTFFTWQGDNDFSTGTTSAASAPVNRDSGDYDNVLPNLDLSLGITDDLKGRFSYSTTIARPDFNNLQSGITGVGAPSAGPTLLNPAGLGGATEGNVALKPLESDNIDISVEWYYGDASYVSVGYFDKKVSNFIGTEPSEESIPGVFNQSAGPRAIAARQALLDQGIPVNQQTLFAMVAAMTPVGSAGCVNNANVPAGTKTCGASFGWTGDLATWTSTVYDGRTGWENGVDLLAVAGDPETFNRVNRPINNEDANLDGVELAWQHFFGDTGFGFQANYTVVNGDVDYVVTDSPSENQFALVGLSDSSNLSLIYENFGWSARVSYNWRDSFLNNANVGANEPEYTEAYEQVDFSVSYEITDNFTMGLEGINVLEEDTRTYGRSTSQLRRLDILGSRYAVSARYNF